MIRCGTSSILPSMDKGEIELKNIARPVHVFVVAGAKVSDAAAPLSPCPTSRPSPCCRSRT